MTLFEKAIEDALTLVEYNYSQGYYELDQENLKALVENVVLASIYDRELQKEVYTENN